MPQFILTNFVHLLSTRRQLSQHCYKKVNNITTGNQTQANQEGGTVAGWSQTRYRYGNFNTPKKLIFKRNITELEDADLNQGFPSDAAKYEEFIDTLINYFQQ